MSPALIFTNERGTRHQANVAVEFAILPCFDERLDATLVAIQQVGINLSEFDFLQLVGNAPFQIMAVIDGRI
nr:hypothetical protein [Ferrovum sp.]